MYALLSNSNLIGLFTSNQDAYDIVKTGKYKKWKIYEINANSKDPKILSSNLDIKTKYIEKSFDESYTKIIQENLLN